MLHLCWKWLIHIASPMFFSVFRNSETRFENRRSRNNPGLFKKMSYQCKIVIEKLFTRCWFSKGDKFTYISLLLLLLSQMIAILEGRENRQQDERGNNSNYQDVKAYRHFPNTILALSSSRNMHSVAGIHQCSISQSNC